MPTKKPVARQPENDAASAFGAIAAAFARKPGVTKKRMFNTENALAVEGKIFAMLTPKDVFVVKLPKARVDAIVAAGAGEHFGPGARKMKEWVSMANGREDWLALAKEAFAYVRPAS
jgi:hypothetical protein